LPSAMVGIVAVTWRSLKAVLGSYHIVFRAVQYSVLHKQDGSLLHALAQRFITWLIRDHDIVHSL
jgi:hypothetical protein